METRTDLHIIGGGIIGLSAGWQCLRAGMSVTLFEKDRVGEGTSSVAAGMLAPEAEVDFGEEALMKLGRKSLSLYPSFLEALKEDAANVPEKDPCGTVLVGKDRDDAEQLRRLFEFRKELGLNVEWWGGSYAREQLDILSPRISSAIWLPDDAQIENRRLLKVLEEAFLARGGALKEGSEVEAIEKDEGGYQLRTGEGVFRSDEVLLCAGASSGRIKGVGADLPGLHPVKGQILTLGPIPGGGLDRMVRSPRVYLVPKADGSIRVGGTSEEMGFDLTPTAGGVRELLEEAWELVPAVQDAAFHGVDVGSRPAHKDHQPSIGRDGEGILHATGHYRHGFLLAPLTAYAIRNILVEGRSKEPLLGDGKN